MIELTREQAIAAAGQEQPAAAIDPQTGQVYRLVKQEVYDVVVGVIKPLSRGWDDDPEMDVYEQFRKKP